MSDPKLDLSDQVLRRTVSKDDDARLRHELSVCQSLMSKEEIDQLQRYELIGYVTLLRQMNKMTMSCRNVITGFDQNKAILHPKDNDLKGRSQSCSDNTESELGGATASSSGVEKQLVISDQLSHSITATKDDSSARLELLLLTLEKNREIKEERDKKEREERDERDRRRDKEAKEEREQKERDRERRDRLDSRKLQEALHNEAKEDRLKHDAKFEIMLKRASDIFNANHIKMADDLKGIVAFFKNMESLFAAYAIDEDLKVCLIQPFLNRRANHVVIGLEAGTTYEQVKNMILTEYNFTPRMYRAAFTDSFRS